VTPCAWRGRGWPNPSGRAVAAAPPNLPPKAQLVRHPVRRSFSGTGSFPARHLVRRSLGEGGSFNGGGSAGGSREPKAFVYRVIETARARVGELIGASPHDLIFTSCATNQQRWREIFPQKR
jgi:hypothetical protein